MDKGSGARGPGVSVPTDDPELPLDGFVTYRLARLQSRLNGQATAVLREHAGLSLAQWRIVALISQHGGEAAGEIAAAAGIDKGQFSRNAKALGDMGLVTMRVDDEDARRHRLDLTPQGRALHARILPVMRERQRHLLCEFDAGERAALFSAIERLSRAAERTDFGKPGDQTSGQTGG